MFPTTTLLGLPLELFEEAATYLSSNDLKALRLVSRACATKVGPYYAKIVHSSNSFTLRDEEEMRRGLMIARHRLIGPALRNIRIRVNEADNSKERKFVDRCDDVKMLTTLFDLLQEAGAKIQEIEVDGSSGWMARPGKQHRTAPQKGDYRRFMVMLRALVKARLSPSSVRVWGTDWALPVRYMGKNGETMDHFRQVLKTVEKLDLHVTLSQESAAGVNTFDKAIGAAPKLTKLDILVNDFEWANGSRRHSPTFLSLLLGQTMPQLERFVMEGGCVSFKKMVAFLKARPTGRLQEFFVMDMCIEGVKKFQRPGEEPCETFERVLTPEIQRARSQGP